MTMPTAQAVKRNEHDERKLIEGILAELITNPSPGIHGASVTCRDRLRSDASRGRFVDFSASVAGRAGRRVGVMREAHLDGGSDPWVERHAVQGAVVRGSQHDRWPRATGVLQDDALSLRHHPT